jgi:tetratricopeptide (TPR) repeat protein
MPKRRSRRNSSARSAFVDINMGIVSTGDYLTINTASTSQRRPRRPTNLVYGDVPRQPPAFQQRDDLANKLAQAGRLAIIIALTGTRGIGKSQLAAAYARKCIEDRWKLVAWIGAERADQTVGELNQLSMALGLRDESDDSISAARKVRRWLECSASQRCLVIFDNAGSVHSLDEWLPSCGNAHIIITSNHRSFGELGTLIEVDAFTPDEAQSYLFERTGLTDAVSAKALANALGRLPLALAQATAVIKARGLSFEEFIQCLRLFPLHEYLSPRPGEAYPRGAAETVLLAVQEAESRGKLIRALILFLSVLSPDGVSRKLLYAAPLGRGVWAWLLGVGKKSKREAIDDAIETLADLSLITVIRDGQAVLMHRFSQRVIRERAKASGTYHLLIMRSVSLIRNATGSHNHEDLYQQISALWSNLDLQSPDDIDSLTGGAKILRKRAVMYVRDLIELRFWCIIRLCNVRNAAQAIPLAKSVSGECQLLLGPDDPQTLTSRRLLGTAYVEAKVSDDETVDLHERILADHDRILGVTHPDTVVCRRNLAVAYTYAGRSEAGIALYRRILDDLGPVLGFDHPYMITTRSNLASALYHAGSISEAIEVQERVLLDQERVEGSKNIGTVEGRNNLAAYYLDAGRHDDAVELCERALPEIERILGPQHPETLTVRTSLGVAYMHVGRLGEAISLIQDALSDFERVFGPHHLDTLNCKQNLATAYAYAEKFDVAIALQRRVVAARERVLGADHPSTLTSRSRLESIVGHSKLHRKSAAPPRGRRRGP